MTTARLHTKYRPAVLDDLIGNEQAVTKLKGMIAKKKFPGAILFTGPPGCGKTTLSRAFAASVNGSLMATNFTEMNMAESRSIEEIRSLIGVARTRPSGAPRRFILMDEVHQLVSNAPAANAFLKPLEEPVPTTTYLLCSMEPDKFKSTTTGRAMASRCIHISLASPTHEDMQAQMRRILEGEKITYLGKTAKTSILENSQSLRELANHIESLMSYYDGLDEKPERLGSEAVMEAIGKSSAASGVIAGRMLTALYVNKPVAVFKEILGVKDAFQFINDLMNIHWFVTSMVVNKGETHPNVWGSSDAWNTYKGLSTALGDMPRDEQLRRMFIIQAQLAKLKAEAAAFAIEERQAIAATAWIINEKITAGGS